MLYNTILSVAFLVASSVAAPVEIRGSSPYFTPSAIWNYNVRTGAILATSTGTVSKADNDNGNDITTLLTFTYPQEAQGQQCQFAFDLDNQAGLSGSGKLDLFTSNQPAPGPTNGWGPGNQRNLPLGRLSAVLGGQATWDATFSTYLTQSTDCKDPGTVEAFELVGVFDNDYVSWDPAVAGPRIIYS